MAGFIGLKFSKQTGENNEIGMLVFSFKFEEHILKPLVCLCKSKLGGVIVCDTFWPLPTSLCKDATRSSKKLIQ